MRTLTAIICTVAAVMLMSSGIAQGNVLIAEYASGVAGAGTVTEIDHNGAIVWQITGLNGPTDADLMPNGNVLIAEFQGGQVAEWTTSGTIAWQITGLSTPYAAERSGNRVLITEYAGGANGAGRVALWNKGNYSAVTTTPVRQIAGLYGPVDAKNAGSHKIWVAEFNGAGTGAGTVTEYLDNAPVANWRLTGFTQPIDIERRTSGILVTERPLGTVTEWTWAVPLAGSAPVGTVATPGWTIAGLNNPRDAEWGPDGYVFIAEQGTTTTSFTDGAVLQVKRSDNSIVWSMTGLNAAFNVESHRPEVWVNDDWNNQTDVNSFNPNLIWKYNTFGKIQQGINGVENSTVNVFPGTYAENLLIKKQLVLQGAGAGSTIIDASGGNFGILIEKGGDSAVDRLVVKGLRVTGAIYDGIRIYKAGGPTDVNHTTFEDLLLDLNGAKGMEIHNDSVVSDMKITNCQMVDNTGQGLRTASNVIVDGWLITDSDFSRNSYGLYLQGTLSNIAIKNTVMNDSNPGCGLYATETGPVANLSIEDCQVSGSAWWGIVLWTPAPAGFSGITVKNTVIDNSGCPGFYIGDTVVSNFLMQDSKVVNNGGLGLWFEGVLTNVVVTNTEIHGNGFGISNTGWGVVKAEFNYWGHWSGPFDPFGVTEVPPCTSATVDMLKNADGLGDGVSNNVDYCPWKPKADGYVAVATNPATDISSSSARLNGRLLGDSGSICKYHFMYWKVGDAWVTSTAWTGGIHSGDSFSEVITGLNPGTLYYFWAEAINALGQNGWDSGLLTFTTLFEPIEVKAPNGGECLLGGNPFMIEWLAAPDINDVLIEYSLDTGTTWHQIATVPNADPKQYNWTVPAMPEDAVLNFHFDNEAALGEDYTAGGVVHDYSAFGNDGQLLDPPGVPTWIPDAGVSGGAFDFTGTGSGGGQSILVVPNADTLNPGPNDFSVAVWIKTRENVDGDILRKGSSSNSSTWYKLEHGPSAGDKLSLNLNTDGTDATVTSVEDYNDGQWHFVVAQRNADQAELWIDGELKGTADVSGSISNDANLAIGSIDTLTDDFLNDSLDEVRIFMRSLSAAEIQLMQLLGNSQDCLVCISDVNDPNVNDVSDNEFCITTYVVPDVGGMAQGDAEAAINAAGLVVGTITSQYNATVPIGCVIGQSPADATPVSGGSPVDLIISLGGLATANPTAQTESVITIGTDTATLRGKILDDGGGQCEYRFYFWTSGDMWITSTAWTGYASTGDIFNQALTGLTPGKRYYYWAEAKNTFGRSDGWSSGLRTFTTQN